jgi:hypothetical protein
MGGGMDNAVLSPWHDVGRQRGRRGHLHVSGLAHRAVEGHGLVPDGRGHQCSAPGLPAAARRPSNRRGHFFVAGTVAASKVAYWDGAAWSAMGIGMDQYVIGLAQMPNGDVFAGGGFATVDNLPSPCLARWATPCYANCDCSTTNPTLNVLDFSCFLNKFAAGDPDANCDGSSTAPVLNVLDFGCFLNRFAAGCD